MEELIVLMFKAMWGVVQIFYYSIRFIFQTIFFLHSKIPKDPQVFNIPQQSRFEHTLIVGGSGHGKTQLLQHLFMTLDLHDVASGRKSVVFIDSQGDMLQKILHLRELTPSPPHVVEPAVAQSTIIEPQEEEKPPEVATPPKVKTVKSRLWHTSLVFLLHVLVLVFMVGMTILLQSLHWPNGILVVLSFAFGLVVGGALRIKLSSPIAIEAPIGALLFFGIMMALGQQTDAVLASLFISLSLGLGFAFTHGTRVLRKKRRERAHASQVNKGNRQTRAPPRWEPTLADRLILIDPNDVENPPCLNLFDFGLDRIKDYSAVEREKFVNSAIALYEYMFGALLGAELSQRQGVIFRYLARLLMVVPNPTIYTLMDFMEEPERVREYLPRLDVQTQRFFVTQFFSHKFDDTRQQILTRLWGVLSNNVLARMFSHSHNKLNLFEAMNRGSLILINTAKDLLKQEGCEIFGRFMITCISQATQERAALPEGRRLPTFIYIDEAADYFDDSLEELLNTARKYMVGLIIATQNLGQFSHKLLASVLSSTSIKYAGGVSRHDAVALAGEMKADPEFILAAQKGGGQTQFVAYVRNAMQEAIGFVIPLGQLERSPKMSPDDFQELLKRNREKYTASFEPALLQTSSAVTQSGLTFALDEPQRPI